jgi:hypothetical protein
MERKVPWTLGDMSYAGGVFAIAIEQKSRAAGVAGIEMSIVGTRLHKDASGPAMLPTRCLVDSAGPGQGTACAVAACGGRAELGAMSQGTSLTSFMRP